jgi:hypothetical protein
VERHLPTEFSSVRDRFIVLIAVLLSGSSFAKNPDARLPVITGKDLNGTSWLVPAGLPGDRTLVLVGFEESQQQDIDIWTQGLGLKAPTNTIPWVEMPLIQNPGMLMRWFINTGMQSGIKDLRIRSHVWTAYTDKKTFMRSCGMVSDESIFAMVVNRSGQLLSIERGAYSKDGEARLLGALRQKKN